jgi:hypothetical protein
LADEIYKQPAMTQFTVKLFFLCQLKIQMILYKRDKFEAQMGFKADGGFAMAKL